MANVYDDIAKSVNAGLRRVEDMEDLIEYKRSIGERVTEDENKLRQVRTPLLKHAAELSRRGYAIEYGKVNPE